MLIKEPISFKESQFTFHLSKVFLGLQFTTYGLLTNAMLQVRSKILKSKEAIYFPSHNQGCKSKIVVL